MSNLGANIKYYRKLNSFTQHDLGKMLGVRNTVVSGWELGDSNPSIETVIQLSEIFGISLDELIVENPKNTKGDPSKKINQISRFGTGNLVQVNADSVQASSDLSNKNILIPIKAQASYSIGWPGDFLEDGITFIDVPGISGEARTFEIGGTSMYPVIQDGDLIACNRVDRRDEIKEGVVYVITTRDSGIFAKYLRPVPQGLQLISANHLEYMPFYVELNDVLEIWEAKVRISKSFDPIIPIDSNTRLLPRINKIEAFISQIFPDFNQED